MPALKPQIRNLFATPVCIHFLPVAQDVNAQLRPLVLGRLESTPSHGQGVYTAPDFEDWGTHQAQTLFRVLRELADSMTATQSGGRVELAWRIEARAGLRRMGEHQEMTARPGGVWSAVYYVDDGYAKSDDQTLGGECVLRDPRGAAAAMPAAHLCYRVPGGQSAGQSERIRPQSGMIVLHPSWLARGEQRLGGSQPRITIEFELFAP